MHLTQPPTRCEHKLLIFFTPQLYLPLCDLFFTYHLQLAFSLACPPRLEMILYPITFECVDDNEEARMT